MRKSLFVATCLGSFLFTLAAAGQLSTIVRSADELVALQSATGTWAGEEAYSGSIVAGLISAYQATDDNRYLQAARAGGNYILSSSGGNYYGDGAYALAKLAQVDRDQPAWATAVRTFYDSFVPTTAGGTSSYIQSFSSIDPSTAAVYLSQHALAASLAGSENAPLWRQAVLTNLARINDDSYTPVGGVGVSLWALAQTGPLDNTRIDATASGDSPWADRTLADLPSFMLSHFCDDQSQNGFGTFYWRFDHSG